jgi:hypothetical protein
MKKENCTITKTLDTIRVSGSEKLLADLGDEIILGIIDLALFEKSQVVSFNIPDLPEGITNLSEKTSVDVTVTIPSFPVREFAVTQIKAVNDGGKVVTFSTLEKIVKLRGPKAYLDQLTSADLKIEVDFTNAEAGMADFKAEVIVSAKFAEFVGAVGTYDVKANVELVNG